jgi:deoxyribonuclease-4
MNIGCHISIAGGIENAPPRALELGCEAMQIFTRPPQGGKASELSPEIIKKFKLAVKNCGLKAVYIHAPYYINFASKNNRIRYGSTSVIRAELERGSLIGAKYVMTHLGTAKDLGQVEAVKKTVEMLKKTLEDYIGSTKLLLENSAGAGQIIGDDLAELGEVIKKVGNGAIAGICLDTQHSFASGYNWLDFENNLKRLNREIGLENIKLMHANDSQSGLGSNRDRHAHIGNGEIGLEGFKNIVAFAKKNNIDMLLETESDKVRGDIKILKSLRNSQ